MFETEHDSSGAEQQKLKFFVEQNNELMKRMLIVERIATVLASGKDKDGESTESFPQDNISEQNNEQLDSGHGTSLQEPGLIAADTFTKKQARLHELDEENVALKEENRKMSWVAMKLIAFSIASVLIVIGFANMFYMAAK